MGPGGPIVLLKCNISRAATKTQGAQPRAGLGQSMNTTHGKYVPSIAGPSKGGGLSEIEVGTWLPRVEVVEII